MREVESRYDTKNEISKWVNRRTEMKEHTMGTIHNRAFNARYSTPPISSICSLVSKWKVEFLPTIASNVMYGTCFAPGLPFPWLGVIETVAGIVIVRASFRLNAAGKSRARILLMIAHGIGNPPKPRFLLLLRSWKLWWVCWVRSEWVRAKEDRLTGPSARVSRDSTESNLVDTLTWFCCCRLVKDEILL